MQLNTLKVWLITSCMLIWVSGHTQTADITATHDSSSLVIALDEDYYPLSFVDDKGGPQGLFVDIWKLWSERTGVDVSFHTSNWSDTLKTLRNGNADLHSGLFSSPSRSKWLDFSKPFYGIGSSLFFKAGERRLSTIDDIDKTDLVGVELGSYQQEYLISRNVQTRSYANLTEIVKAMRKGDIQAFLAESPTTQLLLDSLRAAGRIESSGQTLFTNHFYAGVPKGKPALLKLVNLGLKSITTEELIAIERRWISYPGFRYFRKPQSSRDETLLSDEERLFLAKHPVIRTGGDPNWPPFDFTSNGNVQGLSADYLNILGNRLGVKFELASQSSWPKVMQKLKQGDLDLVRAMMKNEARSRNFLFTQPYSDAIVAIFTRTGDEYRNLEQLNGKTVAIEQDYFTYEALQAEYPAINLLVVNEALEALEAVSENRADAYVGTLAVGQYQIERHFIANLKVSANVPLQNKGLTFAVRKDWPLLRSALDKAISSLTAAEHLALRRPWQVRTEWAPIVNFSQIEKDWIKANPNIRFTGDPEWLPFEGFSTEEGYQGIAAEVLKRIEHITGLEFERVPSKSWFHAVEMAIENKVDVLSDDLSNAALNDTHTFTDAYLTRPLAIVMRDENRDIIPDLYSIADKRIAVVAGYGYLWELENHYPDIVFNTEARTIEKALQSVASGEVDALIVTFTAGSYQINQLGVRGLRIVGTLPVNMRLGMAVRRDWPVLLSIINKAISSITPAEMNRIVEGWMDDKFVQRVDYRWVWRIGAISVAALLLLLAWVATVQSQKKRLRNSEERFTLAMKAASEGIWDWNIRTGETYFSPGYMNMLGYEPNELPPHQQTWQELLHPDDLNRALSEIQHGLKKAAPNIEQEYRLRHKHGGYRTILSKGGVVSVDNQGRATRAVGTQVDITELKAAESALKVAKRQAEQASRFKSQFLANISHEIRTPLNAIVGFLHLTLKTELSPPQIDLLKKVKVATHNLLSIIEDILNFSKIEAGKIVLDNREFSLRSVFDNIAYVEGLKAQDKELELSFSISNEVPDALIGDPVQLGQILINLTSNAIKFTEQGEIAIRVDLCEQNSTQVSLEFSVRDTGVGIKQEDLDRLFKPFEQADGSSTRRFGGTGLGLSIIKTLTEKMKGKLLVDSTPGQGSCFRAIIPFQTPQSVTEIAAKSLNEPNSLSLDNESQLIQLTIPNLEGSYILLVEDNRMNQQVVSALVAQTGANLSICNNGKEAIDTLLVNAFDLVLMDLQMPEVDGFEATQEIRTRENLKSLPIIALSAHAMATEKQRCTEIGINDVLTKPFDPDTFYKLLRQWIPNAQNKNIKISQQNFTDNMGISSAIDIDTGLLRVGGNRKLYFKLAHNFINDHQQDLTKIRRALQEQDLEHARQLVHTVRGASGTLGALALEAHSESLELAILAEQSMDTPFKAFASEFEIVLQALRALLGDLRPSQTEYDSRIHESDIDWSKIALLYELLCVGSVEALTQFHECKPMLQKLLPALEVLKTMNLIESFDFDDASQVIESLLNQAKPLESDDE